VTLVEALVEAIRRDYKTAPIDERDRVMLDYAAQITRDATGVTPTHHERLRAAGYDDRGILQITLIASWFNYINRVADALGVGRS
jgi:alkylhydroperoxidase family enzyme